MKTLNEINIGDTATVVSLAEAKPSDFLKLTSMGILPGARVTIVQKKPITVFRIGFSRFAIDFSLAKLINVSNTNQK